MLFLNGFFNKGCRNFLILIRFEIVDFLIYCFECFFIVLIKFCMFLLIIVCKKLINKDVFLSFVKMGSMLLLIMFRMFFINFKDELIFNNVKFLKFFSNFLYFDIVF